jgi:predicted DNA-binding protein (MmcQ/YjbR family)
MAAMESDSPLERVRALCTAFPETEERLSHGEPTWFVRGKRAFAMFANQHHDDRVAVWLAAAPGAQEIVPPNAPGRYFVPPYYGPRGWIAAYLDVPVDWDELAGLIADAHAFIASKLPAPRTRPSAR